VTFIGVMLIHWMHGHHDSCVRLRAEVLVNLHSYAVAQTDDMI